jgi:DNA polymerase III subunit epsilon
MRSVVLDTETTGMPVTDGHRIIEIGCVELEGRRLTGRHFHVYLNPDREIDEGAIAVHGITNDFVADKPRFKEIADELTSASSTTSSPCWGRPSAATSATTARSSTPC